MKFRFGLKLLDTGKFTDSLPLRLGELLRLLALMNPLRFLFAFLVPFLVAAFLQGHAEPVACDLAAEPDLEHKTLSPDGKRLVVFYQDGWDEVISIRDAESGEEVRRIIGHGDTPNRFEFSKDGKLLASSCPRNGFAVWDVATGKQLLRLPPTRAEDKPGSEPAPSKPSSRE